MLFILYFHSTQIIMLPCGPITLLNGRISKTGQQGYKLGNDYISTHQPPTHMYAQVHYSNMHVCTQFAQIQREYQQKEVM